MYRIVKESIPNYRMSTVGYRQQIAEPFMLMLDINIYNAHKREQTILYKKLSDFLYAIRDCEKCSVIFRELSAWGIEPMDYGITSDKDKEEMHKIMHMLLNLAYWE